MHEVHAAQGLDGRRQRGVGGLVGDHHELCVVAVALLFSLAVGVIFGVWPARQAARLDPISALRWE